MGGDVLDRREQDGWGSRVIDRLAQDLQAVFPDQRGWSRRNLHDMRALAEAWPPGLCAAARCTIAVGGHLIVLLDKPSTRQERDLGAESKAVAARRCGGLLWCVPPFAAGGLRVS